MKRTGEWAEAAEMARWTMDRTRLWARLQELLRRRDRPPAEEGEITLLREQLRQPPGSGAGLCIYCTRREHGRLVPSASGCDYCGTVSRPGTAEIQITLTREEVATVRRAAAILAAKLGEIVANEEEGGTPIPVRRA